MNSRILKINPDAVKPRTIREIVRVLAKDGIFVYPTDTFYGLGGSCLSQNAIRRIFEIKKRSASKGLPVLVSDIEMAKTLVSETPAIFYTLAARFWPGPLTMVMKAASPLPSELVGSTGTIGVRLPAIVWLQTLIREIGVPLVTTSANISGEGEIAAADEVIHLFQRKVDLIVDGGQAPGGKPSTVIDLTGKRPAFIRDGVIPKEMLEEFLT